MIRKHCNAPLELDQFSADFTEYGVFGGWKSRFVGIAFSLPAHGLCLGEGRERGGKTLGWWNRQDDGSGRSVGYGVAPC